MASYQSSKATSTHSGSHYGSVNRRLREDLSPVRSPSRDRSRSPTSSTSSREYPSKRPHGSDRHDGYRAGKRRRYDDWRGGKHSQYEQRHRQSYNATDSRYDHVDRERTEHRRYESKRGSHPVPHEARYAKDRSRDSFSPSTRDTTPTIEKRKIGAVEQLDEEHKLDPSSGRGQGVTVQKQEPDQATRQATLSTNVHETANKPAPYRLTAISSTGSTTSKVDSPVNGAGGNTESAKAPATGTKQVAETKVETSQRDDEDTVQPEKTELSAEERRKRREALKAKLKNQSTDLRIHAMQQSAPPSQGETPKMLSDSEPVTPKTSPRTPGNDAVVGSPEPVYIADDTELANADVTVGFQGKAEEPSAADYDPTVDMQEDRMTQEKRLGGNSVPASADNDAQLNQSEEARRDWKPKEKSQTAKKPATDDMFASDDDDGDDDMFAAAPAKPSKSVADTSRSKDIDTSMLDSRDDAQGYYRPILGETLDSRYQVQSNLGKGMYSGVVRAVDQKDGHLKAIKITRNNEEMYKTALKEVDVLQKLAEADPNDRKHMVRFERSFMHQGHLCLVFENLSLNLREVLKKFGRDVGINLKAIRPYAQQMFLALSLMRKCNVVHADLKPDNILVSEDRTSLKVCDLGSASEALNRDFADLLVSRFYRAPEIILGYPFDFDKDLWSLDYAIDMWSIGCTLFELFTGKILFTGRDNNQMLRSMMETRGKFSVKMLKKSREGAQYFDDATLYFRSLERDKLTNRDVVKMVNFQQPTRALKDRLQSSAPKKMSESERKELLLFTDLLEKCLALNPEKRITPHEALKHQFIHRSNSSAFAKGA